MSKPSLLLIIFVFFLGSTATAHAYIGPGAGIALVGTFFGVMAAVGTAIVMVIAWPAWILWKKHKANKNASESSTEQ